MDRHTLSALIALCKTSVLKEFLTDFPSKHHFISIILSLFGRKSVLLYRVSQKLSNQATY